MKIVRVVAVSISILIPLMAMEREVSVEELCWQEIAKRSNDTEPASQNVGLKSITVEKLREAKEWIERGDSSPLRIEIIRAAAQQLRKNRSQCLTYLVSPLSDQELSTLNEKVKARERRAIKDFLICHEDSSALERLLEPLLETYANSASLSTEEQQRKKEEFCSFLRGEIPSVAGVMAGNSFMPKHAHFYDATDRVGMLALSVVRNSGFLTAEYEEDAMMTAYLFMSEYKNAIEESLLDESSDDLAENEQLLSEEDHQDFVTVPVRPEAEKAAKEPLINEDNKALEKTEQPLADEDTEDLEKDAPKECCIQ